MTKKFLIAKFDCSWYKLLVNLTLFLLCRLRERGQQHQMLDMLLEQLPDAWLEFLFSKTKSLKIGNLFSSGLLLEFLASYPLFSWFGILQETLGSILNVGLMNVWTQNVEHLIQFKGAFNLKKLKISALISVTIKSVPNLKFHICLSFKIKFYYTLKFWF